MANRAGHVLYSWVIILLGWGVLARFFGALDFDSGREFLAIIALGMLTEWLSVSFPQGQLSGGFSLVLFAYLTYGPESASWISALFALLGQGIVNRGNPLRTTLFNASQYVLALLLADYAFLKAGGGRGAAFGLHDLPALLAMTAVYFFVNHLLVYLYTLPGKQRSRPHLTWTDAFRWDVFAYLLSLPFGLLMYFVYHKVGVAGSLLLFLPVLTGQFILRLYVHVELSNRELFALYQVAKKLKEQISLEDKLGAVLKEARRITAYDAGVIYLWSEEKKVFLAEVAAGVQAKLWRQSRLIKGEGFIGRAIEEQTPALVSDTRGDPQLKRDPGLPQVYRSLAVVPLVAEKEAHGVLILGAKRPKIFQESHLHTLDIIGGQAALAVANAVLLQRLKEK